MFISEELTKAYFGAKYIFSKQDKYRYEIDWGCCDGRCNRYVSNNIFELRKQIDEDNQLSDYEKNILKYGYDREFKEDIKTYHFCIDNAFDIRWYKYKLVY